MIYITKQERVVSKKRSTPASFPPVTVKWTIDPITILFSHQMCHVNYKLCVRPLSLTHSNTNHKANSECSGSGR